VLLQIRTWQDLVDVETSSASSDTDAESGAQVDAQTNGSFESRMSAPTVSISSLSGPLFKIWWPQIFAPTPSEELREQFNAMEMKQFYQSPDWSYFKSMRKKLTKFPLTKHLIFEDMFPKIASWSGPVKTSNPRLQTATSMI
jgi:hypothetical protein